MTVLAASASKGGATAELAEAIGRAPWHSGVAADVRPADVTPSALAWRGR